MNQIGDLSLGDNEKFGLGFAIATEKTSEFPAQEGTFTWGGAFSTTYWVDPKRKNGCVAIQANVRISFRNR